MGPEPGREPCGRPGHGHWDQCRGHQRAATGCPEGPAGTGQGPAAGRQRGRPDGRTPERRPAHRRDLELVRGHGKPQPAEPGSGRRGGEPGAELRAVPRGGAAGVQLGRGAAGGVPRREHRHRAHAQPGLVAEQRQGPVGGVQPDAGAVHERAGARGAGALLQRSAKCNLAGSANPVAGLPECPQGISAVKALGLAAQQGQKIYTITPQVYANQPNIVNTALVAHSPSTRAKVQAALDEGKEVTIHEAPIAQSGWVGAGFTVIEEGTGAGAYTIEGGSNGGGLFDFIVGLGVGALFIASSLIVFEALAALLASTFGLGALVIFLLSIALFALIGVVVSIFIAEAWSTSPCALSGFTAAFGLPAMQLPKALQWFSWVLGLFISADPAAKCIKGA